MLEYIMVWLIIHIVELETKNILKRDAILCLE